MIEDRKIYWTKAFIALALAFFTFFGAVALGNASSKKYEKENLSKSVTINERMQETTKEIKKANTIITAKPVVLAMTLDDLPEAFVNTSLMTVPTTPEPEAEEVKEKITEDSTIPAEPVTEEIITAKVVEEVPSQEFNTYDYGYGIYWTDDDLIAMAITGTGEAEIVKSSMRRAAVYWTILNRVDYYNKSIISIITAPRQFDGYSKNGRINDELLILARDVLSRWSMEKDGIQEVGRILPKDYLWFNGDGKENHFRNAYEAPYDLWNWSLTNPYES